MFAEPHGISKQRHTVEKTIVFRLRDLPFVGFEGIGIMARIENQIVHLVISRNAERIRRQDAPYDGGKCGDTVEDRRPSAEKRADEGREIIMPESLCCNPGMFQLA